MKVKYSSSIYPVCSMSKCMKTNFIMKYSTYNG